MFTLETNVARISPLVSPVRIVVHDYFDHNLDVQEKKHDFKCHQQTVNDVDRVWPVRCAPRHPM